LPHLCTQSWLYGVSFAFEKVIIDKRWLMEFFSPSHIQRFRQARLDNWCNYAERCLSRLWVSNPMSAVISKTKCDSQITLPNHSTSSLWCLPSSLSWPSIYAFSRLQHPRVSAS
jgi:hypothetical protein